MGLHKSVFSFSISSLMLCHICPLTFYNHPFLSLCYACSLSSRCDSTLVVMAPSRTCYNRHPFFRNFPLYFVSNFLSARLYRWGRAPPHALLSETARRALWRVELHKCKMSHGSSFGGLIVLFVELRFVCVYVCMYVCVCVFVDFG